MHTDTVSAHLHRLNWLLRARVVEVQLRELKRAVKAGSIRTSRACLPVIRTAGNGPAVAEAASRANAFWNHRSS